MDWRLAPEEDEVSLLAPLYPRSPVPPQYPPTDFAMIHVDRAAKAVTLMLLWQEYKARHPDACQ